MADWQTVPNCSNDTLLYDFFAAIYISFVIYNNFFDFDIDIVVAVQYVKSIFI